MRVTVLTGGTSSERDVAIASAVQVIARAALPGPRGGGGGHGSGLHPRSRTRPRCCRAVGVEPPSIDQLHTLERGLLLSGLGNLAVVRDADVLFLALHGGRGEDGTIQTLLEMVGVPYTGSGRLGSAMAMDKDISKRLFRRRRGADRRLGDGARVPGPGGARLWVAGGGKALQAGLHGRA